MTTSAVVLAEWMGSCDATTGAPPLLFRVRKQVIVNPSGEYRLFLGSGGHINGEMIRATGGI
jgi:hypothetical protein